MTSRANGLSEAAWEALAMDALGELAWLPVEGKKIAPGSGERESWAELIIPRRLREAIARIPQRRLSESSSGSRHRVDTLAYGSAAHDVYHAGQIQLVKRLFRDRGTRLGRG